MPGIFSLVTFQIYPAKMGGQKGVALFYQYLQRHIAVTLAVSKNNCLRPEQKENTYAFLHPNKSLFFNLFLLRRLQKIVADKGSTAIIAEHSYPAWLALLLHKKTGHPFIIHSHNIEALRFRQMNRSWWKLYGHYERWIHRKAHFNFFISEEDRTYAQHHFGLAPSRCAVITYGVEKPRLLTLAERTTLVQSLGLKGFEKILFFNGTLDYRPNYEAVEILVNEIDPLLQQQLKHYKILICGSRIPESLKRKIEANPNFIYLGFVEDIQPFYKIASLFLNPVLNDSGVKTKVIEALANHCTVVSSHSGAKGILKDCCSDKLVCVPDNNWTEFAAQVVLQLNKEKCNTPKEFFDHYLWDNIAKKAASKIEETISHHA